MVMKGQRKVKANSVDFSCFSKSWLDQQSPPGALLVSPLETLSADAPLRSPTLLLKETQINRTLSSFSLCLQRRRENLNSNHLPPFKGYK